MLPGFNPHRHRPVAMSYLNERCVDVSVTKGAGKVDRGHHGMHLSASTIRSVAASDSKFGLAPERMQQEKSQVNVRGADLRSAPQFSPDAIGQNAHDRFHESAHPIERITELVINSQTLNTRQPRYNSINPNSINPMGFDQRDKTGTCL